jgi:hypothetical protein
MCSVSRHQATANSLRRQAVYCRWNGPQSQCQFEHLHADIFGQRAIGSQLKTNAHHVHGVHSQPQTPQNRCRRSSIVLTRQKCGRTLGPKEFGPRCRKRHAALTLKRGSLLICCGTAGPNRTHCAMVSGFSVYCFLLRLCLSVRDEFEGDCSP